MSPVVFVDCLTPSPLNKLVVLSVVLILPLASGQILFPCGSGTSSKRADPETQFPPLPPALNLHQFATSSFHESGKRKKMKLASLLTICALKFLFYI